MKYKLISLQKELEVRKIATLFYMEYDKNFDFPGEKHDFWELVYCDYGEVIISADANKFNLKKGMIAFHKPGEFHTVTANKKVSPNIIVISFTCVNVIMEEFVGKILTLNEREQKMLAKIVSESNQVFEIEQERSIIYLKPKRDPGVFGGQQYVKNLLEIFLIELIRRQKFKVVASESKDRITTINVNTMYEDITRTIMKYLEDYICENLNIDDLCSKFSFSKSYIEYIFKRETGKGIMAKFSIMKIEKAKELLRNQDYNITMISEMLGYSSVHYFSRKFKAVVGMPPSDYASSIKLRAQTIK